MTKARIQPFCIAKATNTGRFKGKKVYLRSVTEKCKAIFSHNNRFCLIWRTNRFSFDKFREELKSKFTKGNNCK